MTNCKTFMKLQSARVKLSQAGLKKTGKNTFSKYDYYELKDFLAEVNKICEQLKLCPVVIFGSERATLTIYDCEIEDSSIEFSCTNVGCCVKGAIDIQNEGAKQTYLKRYLYMTAFEIAEVDTVEVDANMRAQASGEDMRKNELLGKLARYGLTMKKLIAYKGSMDFVTVDYLESALARYEAREEKAALARYEAREEKAAEEAANGQI